MRTSALVHGAPAALAQRLLTYFYLPTLALPPELDPQCDLPTLTAEI